MLIETQVIRSKSALLKVIQQIPIAKAVVYRNVDRRAWEVIVKKHQGVRTVGMVIE